LAISANSSLVALDRGSQTTINCDINYLICMELFPDFAAQQILNTLWLDKSASSHKSGSVFHAL